MAWTTARSWVTGELVTAALLNAQLRDNMTFLAGSAGDIVAGAEGTASTTYTDLATAGPAVTLTTGTSAIVLVSAEINALGLPCHMGVEVSGASTIAAADAQSLKFAHDSTGGYVVQIGTALFFEGTLTAGSNTFTAKYRTDSGTPTWGQRNLIVIPLP